MFRPMPTKSAISSPSRRAGTSASSSTTSPSGFCMSEATLARNRLAAMPMEQVRHVPASRAIAALMRRARATAFSRGANVAVSSQSTSSIDRTSVTCRHDSMISMSRRWYWM